MSEAAQYRALPQVDPKLADLLARATPFLDLRAPAEFARGAVPGACNLPILDDDERHRVGLTYKQQGQAAAEALGYQLVSGAVKAARVEAWSRFARAHRDAWLYCWRGGQRSQIAQTWLAAAGWDVPRVPGGFKALRHTCLAVLESVPASKPWCVLAGRTGSGKTVLLNRLAHSIDLEGLAHHRGSAFGAMTTPQPAPVGFENALAVALLRHQGHTLIVEDESRSIGRVAVPDPVFERMQNAPLAVLEVPFEQRCANIVADYVTAPLTAGTTAAELEARYRAALERIRRRLGGARTQSVEQSLVAAFARHADHSGWVAMLLRWYYDPMYDYQLERKAQRVRIRGGWEEISAFLASL
ncbi:MAG: tRNA 2-selenouridine(34) synthase MnmH [Pseudomonadales bacterium]